MRVVESCARCLFDKQKHLSDNEEYLKENTVNYTISFNGKARFNMEFAADEASDVIQAAVLADERSQKWIDGKTPKKIIVVPKKIVNVVI